MNKRKGKRGMPLYARICARLIEHPATAREVAADMDIKTMGTVRVLRMMRRHGLLRVVDWRREIKHGIPNEVWAFGPGADAPAPLTQKGFVSSKLPVYRATKLNIEVMAFASLVEALREGIDFHALHDSTGICKSTLQPFIRQLRDLKMIHTCDWLRNPFGNPTPIMKLGRRFNNSWVNAPKPAPQGKDDSKRRDRQQRERFRLLTHCVVNATPCAMIV